MNRLPQLRTSSWQHWTTPVCVLDRVRAFGPIVLDPCANAASLHQVDAGLALLGRDSEPVSGSRPADARPHRWAPGAGDGLRSSWSCVLTLTAQPDGLVYVNPPYGRTIGEWTKKMAEEAGRRAQIIALIPARVDSPWFQEHVFRSAAALVFWRGRLKFGNPPPDRPTSTGAPFPSCIAYWGTRLSSFECAFADAGHLVRTAPARRSHA